MQGFASTLCQGQCQRHDCTPLVLKRGSYNGAQPLRVTAQVGRWSCGQGRPRPRDILGDDGNLSGVRHCLRDVPRISGSEVKLHGRRETFEDSPDTL